MPNRPTGHASAVHERFEELKELGRGGAGVVYLVRDRETGDRLALKRLLGADAEIVQRLKREFRSLANLHHRNLVKLYELGHDETSAYFTMEYLEGQELKQYLDVDPRVASHTQILQPTAAAANDNDTREELVRIARVLGAFEQLAAAVTTLHAAGVLHRDLKPSNVLVANGRVVVLDFGIALELGSGAATVTLDKLSSGTPAYMAPEQVHGDHVGEPNDWYAFGAMLYEALSGVLPIDGTMAQLLQRKQREDPTAIESFVPELPRDVSELCMALLSRAPELRPRGEQVLKVLRSHLPSHTLMEASAGSLGPTFQTKSEAELSLFGREQELETLWAAYREAQQGQCAAVHVFGESGSGKSMLLSSFSDEVARSGFLASEVQPLVLRSRCYERETLPFKALDGAMDALVDHLSREKDMVVGHVLPRDLRALTQLFPALRGLPATERLLAGAPKLPLGLSQARAQAENALRELLQRLAAQRPIVLWIDDLQWGDLDSIGIVSSWLQPPYLPSLLLIFSYRSEEIATSPGLHLLRHALQAGAAQAAPSIESVIAVSPLREDDVRALCKQRFAQTTLPPQAETQVIERIVLEAHGSPFLASQLAALAAAQPSSGEAQLAQLSLEELVRSRSRTLSSSAQQVLDVLSLAGRPIPLPLALHVARVTRDTRAVIHELQSLHLIRTRAAAGERLLEVYHDRLREVVQGMLQPAERLELDRRLFAALRETGSTDIDWLHALALTVGDQASALRYGLLAAARASDMLAFERAAELYARCLELSGNENAKANDGELWQKLALAYAHASHGSKAAATYLLGAKQVSPERALQFERAAASHLICSGRFEEGEALLLRVLERLGLRAPASEAGQYAALVWERSRASLRGLRYTPRTRELSFHESFSAKFLGMLSMETAAYDPLRAAVFQARCLRMALNMGDEEGVARALCAAATMTAVEGSERSHLRAEELLAKADAIGATVNSVALPTNIASARAICAFLTGRIAESIELCQEAEYLLRTASGDSEYHHRFTLAAARIGAMLQLGRYQSAETSLQAYLKEAAATENINAELHISMAQAWADVNADRIDAAVERLDRQREQLPRLGYGLLHVLHMISVMRIGCATGKHDWALSTTHDHWQAFQRSVVKRSDSFSMFAYEGHARLLLCRAAVSGEHVPELDRELRPHRKALGSARRGDAHAELERIEARLAILQGDKAAAVRRLQLSSAGFEAYGAQDQAARNRFALGALLGGADAADMQRSALAFLGELGVSAPLRTMSGYFPELLAVGD